MREGRRGRDRHAKQVPKRVARFSIFLRGFPLPATSLFNDEADSYPWSMIPGETAATHVMRVRVCVCVHLFSSHIFFFPRDSGMKHHTAIDETRFVRARCGWEIHQRARICWRKKKLRFKKYVTRGMQKHLTSTIS